MKKIIVLLLAVIAIESCGSNDKKEPVIQDNQAAEKTVTTADTPIVAKPAIDVTAKKDYEQGLKLVSKSDCSTCHTVAEKMIGPSYVDIANKYEGKAGINKTLAEKIIKGGSGNWGTVPMLPHPTISADDATLMVNYILSVNKQ